MAAQAGGLVSLPELGGGYAPQDKDPFGPRGPRPFVVTPPKTDPDLGVADFVGYENGVRKDRVDLKTSTLVVSLAARTKLMALDAQVVQQRFRRVQGAALTWTLEFEKVFLQERLADAVLGVNLTHGKKWRKPEQKEENDGELRELNPLEAKQYVSEAGTQMVMSVQRSSRIEVTYEFRCSSEMKRAALQARLAAAYGVVAGKVNISEVVQSIDKNATWNFAPRQKGANANTPLAKAIAAKEGDLLKIKAACAEALSAVKVKDGTIINYRHDSVRKYLSVTEDNNPNLFRAFLEREALDLHFA